MARHYGRQPPRHLRDRAVPASLSSIHQWPQQPSFQRYGVVAQRLPAIAQQAAIGRVQPVALYRDATVGVSDRADTAADTALAALASDDRHVSAVS